MQRLSVLIHQQHPFHQIALHQACNAQGVYRVRLLDDPELSSQPLYAGAPTDLLILDQAMPVQPAKALIERLRNAAGVPAVLFVGRARIQQASLAHLAREQGLCVVGELPWPLSTPAFGHALRHARQLAKAARPMPVAPL
ncbi:histidine kinase [Pseudomonas phoenicis]|uniref:histidine kinase n=1 Tax=unclassified Pseudomonas TaxID=196821 RepID=UPI0039A05747